MFVLWPGGYVCARASFPCSQQVTRLHNLLLQFFFFLRDRPSFDLGIQAGLWVSQPVYYEGCSPGGVLQSATRVGVLVAGIPRR